LREENPAISLHRLWRSLLERTDSIQYLAPARGIKVMRRDAMGDPVIGFGRVGHYNQLGADFTLHANGAFRIHYYDHDLKHVCYQTFLGWDWVVSSRVVFFHALHSPIAHFDPTDYRNPIPYFRWNSLRTLREREPLLHLVPDQDSWRIEVHPDEPNPRPRHQLSLEYDEAARRYLRHQRANEGPPEDTRAVAERNQRQIDAISLLLEPYATATRPKRLPEEAPHAHDLATS